MSCIELRPVENLLEKNFFIPSYQRGYKWTEQQVKDLLNDIYEFTSIKNKTEEEFYCLQPLVVKKCNSETIKINKLESSFDNNTWYEVIDGQQRLTTIRILLNYLRRVHLKDEELSYEEGKNELKNEYGKAEYIIQYETRATTKNFLGSKMEGNLDYVDCYYIREAYFTMKKWFEETVATKGVPAKRLRELIINTLVLGKQNQSAESRTVQFIWYEIDDNKTNPIDIFTRINMGKIPLNNSELIKALFLQEKNFKNDDEKLRQADIALEWDNMEYSLQDDKFWLFLNNKSSAEIPARIEFLFNIIYKLEREKNPAKFKTYGDDEYATFRFFYEFFINNNSNVKGEWRKVKEYYLAFKEWYENSTWYHYVGFLVYCKIPISEIFKLYNKSSKKKFLDNLKAKIKELLSPVNCYIKDGKPIIDLPYKSSNEENIRRIFLLYNVIFIINHFSKEAFSEDIPYRFPFAVFKKMHWNIEHIDSFTENEISDLETQKEWINNAFEDLKILGKELSSEEKNKIDNFLLGKKEFDFVTIKHLMQEKAEEFDSSNSAENKSTIGNLTLLDESSNKSYGNSLFTRKRREIIKWDSEGRFIPICTKNVFLKYFDKKGTS